jgi:hypothetical protein
MKISKTAKLVRALESGENISVKSLETRTGLANVRATVDRLRNQGLDICVNTRIVRGQRKSYYRLIAA